MLLHLRFKAETMYRDALTEGVEITKDQEADFEADQDVFFGPSLAFARVFKKALFVGIKEDAMKDPTERKQTKAFTFMEEEPIFSQILHNMTLG